MKSLAILYKKRLSSLVHESGNHTICVCHRHSLVPALAIQPLLCLPPAHVLQSLAQTAPGEAVKVITAQVVDVGRTIEPET